MPPVLWLAAIGTKHQAAKTVNVMDASDVTAECLLQCLIECGELANGGKLEVVSTGWQETGASRLLRFGIQPHGRSYILKLPKPPVNDSEHRFYNVIVPQMDYSPSPRHVVSGWDPNAKSGFVILEDLSPTHLQSELDIPPTQRQSEGMIDCLAQLHASWWDSPQLRGFRSIEESGFGAWVKQLVNYLPSFFERMGDRLQPEDVSLISRVARGLTDAMVERLRETALTFVHGDAHAWNFLIPRGNGDTKLIDWNYGDDEFRVNFGMWDVAYMMVHWWFPRRRQKLQPLLLERYHARLVAFGVQEYDKERMLKDFGLASQYCLLRPIVESQTGHPWSWYPQLEHALQAVKELCPDQ